MRERQALNDAAGKLARTNHLHLTIKEITRARGLHHQAGLGDILRRAGMQNEGRAKKPSQSDARDHGPATRQRFPESRALYDGLARWNAAHHESSKTDPTVTRAG